MIENARRGGHRVRVEMELEQEKYNGCSEEQRWCRDGETETLSKSNTSLELLEESIYNIADIYYLCDNLLRMRRGVGVGNDVGVLLVHSGQGVGVGSDGFTL